MIRTRRIHEPATPEDGYRVLVDRLWPRGIRKDAARIDAWPREIAPSTVLRRWFDHNPAKWPEFVTRFRAELDNDAARAVLADLRVRARSGTVTLVFGARETRFNNASVLADLLREP
jgi:uncharacterized protein YeaO (DUF488 family)